MNIGPLIKWASDTLILMDHRNDDALPDLKLGSCATEIGLIK